MDIKISKEKMLEMAQKLARMDFCPEQKMFYKNVLELLKADAEGRLVMLPCKVGDTVYHIGWNCRKGVSYNCEVDGIMTAANCRYCRDKKPCDLHRCVKEVTFEDELEIFERMLSGEFEKQLFITREEAEAALEKMGDLRND